jgi:hypothetical protein
VLIILPPNPTNGLREQMRRLWCRNRPHAVWLGSNISAAIAVWLLLTFGLPVAGLYLGDRGVTGESVLLVVSGVVVGVIGPTLGEVFRRRAHRVLLSVAGVFVREATAADAEDRARPTKMERQAIADLRDGLAHIRQLAREAEERSQGERLREAREHWQRVQQTAHRSIVSP